MAQAADDKFYERADAHIHLSNAQLTDISAGKVSASMMYATARFNAWLTACGFQSGDEMAAKRTEEIDYFLNSYRSALEEHFDDYISNFKTYMQVEK